MANLTRYIPSPICLPADGDLSRTFYDKRQHLSGRPPLENSDYAGYETHTIFNDVFLDADGQSLRAIGPPLVNLKAALLPLVATVIDSSGSGAPPVRLKHIMKPHDRVTMHRFALPSQLRDSNQLTVRFEFNSDLLVEQPVTRQQLPAVDLQFITLQKNNPVRWVLDWLIYGHQLGVDRFLLYDNASDNREELASALESLPVNLDVVLIDWDFAYGPVRSFYNQFCQASQNNHAYQCFGGASWTGHFDVDEYLSGLTGGELKDLLKQSARSSGLLRFDSYLMPNVTDGRAQSPSAAQMPTVRDFVYRARKLQGKAHKYIAQNKALKMANTHNGRVKFGYRRTAVKPDRAAFLHYVGLTTNWRQDDARIHAEPVNPSLHTIDNSVVNLLDETRYDGSPDTAHLDTSELPDKAFERADKSPG